MGEKLDLYLMDLNWNSASVVVYADFPLLTIYCNLDGIHVFVPLLVVGGINEDLIEDLVQPGYKIDFSHFHTVHFGVVYPHWILTTFDRADVSIWPFDDVLELRKLAIQLVLREISSRDLLQTF